ncbi:MULTISPECIES: type II secretion system F family protein [Arthrobacter]|uniref:Type II secretion system F family protein n=1 Tax=Arthrobacter oryzae TaxID=409290 RepID=A0A3N0BKC6_9MICC|nr:MULTISPECIES: type II secretion system F family protein [Arthrobacter]QYF89502.1 type II secretion system F family protein [Arthrobacter sp. PAMC25284]RNL48867.1 type II secretion system F family protein [Arthrobacter oryzae]
MSATVWLLIAAVILPMSYFAWSVIAIDRTTERAIQSRLVAVAYRPPEVASGRKSRLVQLTRQLTPRAYVAHLDRLLGNAGRPASMPLERLLTIKPLAALGGAIIGLILGGAASPQGTLLALCITAACYFLPDLLIYNTGTKRQARIALDLPNVMDQLLISVEAGLGFEVAMARVGSKGKGPLAEEMVRTLQDIQAGRTRREAYKAMAARSKVPDLRSFVGAIIQADVQGLSIARVLKPQADQMRIKRRLRAEEKAMKLPVAVVFPLLLFIFPPLFIVILGPAAINILHTFSG